MNDNGDSATVDFSDINEATVQDVVRALRDCTGHYAFLIGAGTSRPAGIPTAGDLIWEWKQERYIEEYDEVDDVDDVENAEIEDWADSYEDDYMESDNDYGFWFEEIHTTPGQRRHLIREKVEDKNPTFGNIVLASLMADRYVPLTLTPNFDDLVYDALYRFLEEKPLVINHDAVAAEFSLTKDRPTIIKLHGDYLFNNLQNLDEETDKLQANMERSFSLALNEYGLVVVGYGGDDKSIMDEVLLGDIEIPEYGIYWCARDRNKLSDKAAQLLDKENTYFVEIDGSEPFFTKLARRIPGVNPPGEEELRENAESKIQAMKRTIEQREEEAESEEEEDYLDALQYRSKLYELSEADEWEKVRDVASELISVDPDAAYGYHYRGLANKILGNYEQAIEDYDRAIDIDSENTVAYANRGGAYNDLGNYERAIEDFDKNIELDPEETLPYINRAEAKLGLGAYEDAHDDALKAYEIAERTDMLALSLLLLLIIETVLDKGTGNREEEYREICSESFSTIWDSTPIRRWIDETDLNDEDKEYIRNMLSLIEDHAPNR